VTEGALRIMLVGNEPLALGSMAQALRGEGHAVVEQCRISGQLLPILRSSQADLLMVQTEFPGRVLLDALARIQRELARPVILFAERSDSVAIRRAIAVGVSAYLVGGVQAHRLAAVIEVCLARFQMQDALRRDLQDVCNQLADARDIEKAKGLLMKSRAVDEHEALNTLRKMATDRQQPLGDFARSVLLVASTL